MLATQNQKVYSAKRHLNKEMHMVGRITNIAAPMQSVEKPIGIGEVIGGLVCIALLGLVLLPICIGVSKLFH